MTATSPGLSDFFLSFRSLSFASFGSLVTRGGFWGFSRRTFGDGLGVRGTRPPIIVARADVDGSGDVPVGIFSPTAAARTSATGVGNGSSVVSVGSFDAKAAVDAASAAVVAAAAAAAVEAAAVAATTAGVTADGVGSFLAGFGVFGGRVTSAENLATSGGGAGRGGCAAGAGAGEEDAPPNAGTGAGASLSAMGLKILQKEKEKKGNSSFPGNPFSLKSLLFFFQADGNYKSIVKKKVHCFTLWKPSVLSRKCNALENKIK